MAEIGVGVREGGSWRSWKTECRHIARDDKRRGMGDNKGGGPPPFPLFPPPSLPLVVPVPTAAASDALIGRPGRSEIKSGRWSAGLLSERQEQQQNKKLKRRDKKQKPSGAEGP